MKELFRSYKWLIVIILLGILSTIAFQIFVLPDNRNAINVILPHGFKGPVLIVLNQENGHAYNRSYNGVDLEIPESGILYTQFSSGHEAHSLNFAYRNQDDLTTIYERSQDGLESSGPILIECISTGLHGRIDLNNQVPQNGYNIFSFLVTGEQGTFDCEDIDLVIDKVFQK